MTLQTPPDLIPNNASQTDYKSLLLSLDGRITRSTYWLKYTLPLWALLIIAAVLDKSHTLYYIVAVITLYPSIAVSVKRAHDRNRSGWFLLLFFIPFVNIWPFVELSFLRGTVGPNDYGNDPLA